MRHRHAQVADRVGPVAQEADLLELAAGLERPAALHRAGEREERFASASKVFTQELFHRLRDPDDLVRGLTVELEVELGLGPAVLPVRVRLQFGPPQPDRKSTRLNSSHSQISYAVFCLKKK